MNTVKFIKIIMKLRQNYPISPDQRIGELGEVFRHDVFLKASDIKKEK